MTFDLCFAVLSDLHIGLPHTIADHPTRFHLVEVSIPAFEQVLQTIEQRELDFLLIPGDLTQHGEPENHRWLAQRLGQLPFPVYVIPGNHDVPVLEADGYSIPWQAFPDYYREFGYTNPEQLYYTAVLSPGVRLIALNSNQFDAQGRQVGRLDAAQLAWLRDVLAQFQDELVLVMIHHNVLEHLPNQAQHPIGRRYMLENAPELLQILREFQVKLVLTGHLHVQDIAHQQGLYDITTGSLVSYPHPYRVMRLTQDAAGAVRLNVESHRVETLPNWPNLGHYSREWMGDRSVPFMTQLLTQAPLQLSLRDASRIAPQLRYFWAEIAAGDPEFTFPALPEPLRSHFEGYSHRHSAEYGLKITDNHVSLCWVAAGIGESGLF